MAATFVSKIFGSLAIANVRATRQNVDVRTICSANAATFSRTVPSGSVADGAHIIQGAPYSQTRHPDLHVIVDGTAS